MLVDEQKIQRQRAANQNIRSLLGARRVAKAAISVPLAPNQGLCVGSLAPEGKAEPSDPAAEAAAAALDAASTVQSDAAQKAAQVPVPGDRKRPAHPLAEFMSLPDLLESSPSPPHRPLQPWQLQQHQQLLRLQQQELQQNDRRNRLWQSERGPSRGPKPLHHSRHHSDSAASPGAAAVAAAGAAAVAAGADFFGRLHAECLEVIRMLRPTEEESAKKREVRLKLAASAKAALRNSSAGTPKSSIRYCCCDSSSCSRCSGLSSSNSSWQVVSCSVGKVALSTSRFSMNCNWLLLLGAAVCVSLLQWGACFAYFFLCLSKSACLNFFCSSAMANASQVLVCAGFHRQQGECWLFALICLSLAPWKSLAPPLRH